MNRPARSVAFVFALVLGVVVLVAPPVAAISSDVVISQVYGGSNSAGPPASTYRNDFVELFNRGTSTVSLAGWSVQYSSATGTGNFSGNPITNLSGSLAPGQYYLVQMAGGTTAGAALPTADATGTVNMSGTAGKVIVANTTTGLACNGGSTPCTAAQLAQIVDLVGWGTANFFEGTVGPATSNILAAMRGSNGCTETDNNGSDFAAVTPAARNTATTPAPCAVADAAPSVSSTTPTNGATGVVVTSDLTVTFSEAVNTAAGWYGIACGTSGAHTAVVTGGPTSFTINPDTDFAAGESCTVTIYAAQVTDVDTNDPPDNMAANYTWSFTTASPLPNLTINDVSLAEGNSGTTTFTFTVSLSAPAPTGGVTFDIATANGTAVAPGDYTANSLTGQTIPAGSSTYTFDVLVNGDTTVEPNETFFVNVTNATNAIVTDGQGQGTITNDDFTPIHTIQGNGLISPFAGSAVTTSGIVTALKYNNGFFLQEPDATVDADPNTSEGIFVFTSTAPTVSVGQFVTVTGTVSEYNQAGQYGVMTELVAPLTINVVSSGNPLPAPIAITAAMTSPSGTWEQLENLEGMRVSVAGFNVTAATDGNPGGNYTTGTSYGDCYGVVPGVARPFREEGIAFPKAPPAGTTIPPLLRFDSNPETLRVDTDGQVGAARQNFSARTVLPAFVGVLDYGFSRYSILPDVGSLPASPAEFTGAAVTAPLATEFTVASYNLQRFYDDVDDPAFGPSYEPVLTTPQYQARLAKASIGIRNYMRMPDVIGVIEMENITALQTLATRISTDAVAAGQPDPLYQAYLIEGNDVGAIDVGFLVKTAVVGGSARVQVVSVTQQLDGTLFTNVDGSTETLNDRPPLMLRAVIHGANGGTFPVTVIVNHLRSMNGVDDDAAGSNGWATVGARVRAKRQAQAVDLANLVQGLQTADPSERIILVGDFNAFSVNDSLGDLVATIAGTPAPDATTAVPGDGTDLVNPDLVNLGPLGPAAERYSYVYDFTAQMIDQGLVNAALVNASLARRVEFARINADFPEIDRSSTDFRLSDHDPLVVYVQAPSFLSAGITTTVTDAPDPVFPGAGLTYTITVANGGPDAATGLTLTDAIPAGTTFASLTAAAGWSCTTPAVGATGNVTCTIATLAAAANAVFTLNVSVSGGAVPGTVITDTAAVTQTSTEGTPGDESATTTTTVQTPPALYATKTVTGPAFPGGPLTWTITLTNTGTTPQADNPGNELVDVLPATVTLVSASATSGTAVATVATNTVTWNGSIAAGGTVTITILSQVNAGATIGQVITNQATFSYDADGNGTNETAAVTDDPGTGAVGDPTSIPVTLGAGGVAVVPVLGGFGLGFLAALVALGGVLLLGRRLS